MTNENYTRWRGVMQRAYKIIRPEAEGTPATLDTITLINTIERLCEVLEKQKMVDSQNCNCSICSTTLFDDEPSVLFCGEAYCSVCATDIANPR